jgi:hypothetical protein
MSARELTYEEAVEMLPSGDTIHTFVMSGGTSIGSNWSRQNVLDLLRRAEHRSCGEPGGIADRMGHRLCAFRDGNRGPLFIKTREDG